MPSNTLEHAITPVLFEASRLLSIVPAVFGVLYNLYHAVYAPINAKIAPIDYAVSALWVRYYFNLLHTHLTYQWLVTPGRSYGIPVPQPHHRPVPKMEGLLSPIVHPDSAAGAPGYLLASNTSQPGPDRSRATTGGLLGRDRQLHLLFSSRPIMGDEQPLVGVQQRRRELATQARWALGWETLGLERGADQVWRPHGRVLLCHGVGGGVTPRTERVLDLREFRPALYNACDPIPYAVGHARLVRRDKPILDIYLRLAFSSAVHRTSCFFGELAGTRGYPCTRQWRCHRVPP